ncbi:MAG: hypothetical protein ACM3VU_00005, partial [Arthrospira platensis]
DWEFSGNAAHLVETTEDSLSGAPVTQTLATVPLTSAPNNTIWLRMVKHGPRDGVGTLRRVLAEVKCLSPVLRPAKCQIQAKRGQGRPDPPSGFAHAS